jgi:hypothetical protein
MVLDTAESLERVPGIESVSTVSFLPLDGISQLISAGAPDQGPPRAQASQVLVGPAFFSTAGVAIVRGRALTGRDAPGASDVAVISASLAQRLWPDAEAVGQTLLLAHGRASAERAQIVGVARDVRYLDPWGNRRLLVYRLGDPDARYVPSLLLKTSGPSALSLPDVRRALVRSPDDAALLRYVRTADQQIDRMLQPQRSAGVFLGVTAVLAMLVAGIGLHYALSYTVEHRRKEIALRIAIGGSPLAVSAEILRRSALLALAASVAGTIGSAAFTPLLAAQAKGVPSRDGATLLTVGAVLLIGCAAVASCSMARAARTNLTESLRLE